MRLKSIAIRNFKSLRHIGPLEIKPLTLLTGINSCGKTSILQCLLLLKQSIEDATFAEPLKLNGKLVSLGTYQDLIYNHQTNLNFGVNLDINLVRPRFNIYKINLDLEFCYMSKQIKVYSFKIQLFTKEQDQPFEMSLVKIPKKQKQYKLTYNSEIFIDRRVKLNESYQILKKPIILQVSVDFYKLFPTHINNKTK